jgi:hypothetical protein
MVAFLPKKARGAEPFWLRRRIVSPQYQGLGDDRRARHRGPLREGGGRPLGRLSFVREVHARHQGPCGCAFTAEITKGQYVYYHCTEHRGPCGNTYVREEELIRQFGELLKQIRIPTELAGKLATVLRESQTDKEKFVRTSMLRLQQQQMLLRSKLDRVYEDRLSDAIPEELWNSNQRRCRTSFARSEPRWSVTRWPVRRTRRRDSRF